MVEDIIVEKEIRVYFCPDCGSKEIKYIFGMQNIFGMVPTQKCGGCGLESGVFPILVIDNKKLNKIKIKSDKKFKTKQKKKSKKK
tara:strand:- start:5005 stop:5259 length:255 start_codon:yes stop_codon:yes gene_type:complete